MGKLHFTVGVYNDDSFKINGVAAEDLKGHIAYNIAYRPGRAFIVDGKCENRGYLTKERCDAWEVRIREEFSPPTRCTAPYQ